MKTKGILIILLTISSIIYGQDNDLIFSCGLGSYNMSALKEFQENNLNDIDPFIQARLLEDFPANTFFSAEWIFTKTKKYRLGYSAGFHATGSQIHYSDFSGELSFRLYTNAFVNSLNIDKSLIEKDTKIVYLYSKLSMYLTIIDFEYKLVIYNNETSETIRSESLTPALELGAHFDYYYYKNLFLKIQAGYLIDSGLPLMSAKYNRFEIYPYSFYSVLKANWSGIRISLSAGISF